MKKKIILGIFSLAFAVAAINASNQNDDDYNNSVNLFEEYGLYDTPTTSNNNNVPQFPSTIIVFTNNNNISPFDDGNKITQNSPSPLSTDQRVSSIIFSSDRNSASAQNSDSTTALERLVELSDQEIAISLHGNTTIQENNNSNDITTIKSKEETSPIDLQNILFNNDRQSPTQRQTPMSIPEENSYEENLNDQNYDLQILQNRYIAHHIENQQLFSEYLRAISQSAQKNTPSKRKLNQANAKKLGNDLTNNQFNNLNKTELENLKTNLLVMQELNSLTFTKNHQKLLCIIESKLKK